MPTVSVVMPVYNGEKYLREAIDSILAQTFTDFEFIIVNDGSDDGTKEIIRSYDDARIVYLENRENSGIVVTLNKGLDRAVGKYIARMDSDDIAVKERFEKQVAFLDRNKDIGLLGTGICIFGEGIEREERVFTKKHDLLKAELIFHSCFAHPTVMMRRSVLADNDLRYNENFAGREDFALWWEIVKVSRVATLSDILLYYRIHNKQITQRDDGKAGQNALDMLKLRMSDIGVNLTDGELKSLLIYCRNKGTPFEYEDCICFINGIDKIMIRNKKIGFFNGRALKRVLESAVVFMYNNADVTGNSKKKIFKYLFERHICSARTTVKLLCREPFDTGK